MINESIAQIFERDLNKLKEEISLYTDENTMWKVTEGISNSAGNLCLHLLGNLNHFIGATLGKTGYVRNREAEFALKNIARTDLLKQIDETKAIVTSTIKSLTDEDIQALFPVEIMGKQSSVEYILIHLATHLSYHLGQINYHRRLIYK
jgi:uncharacterized damage-inducible protein DinB